MKNPDYDVFLFDLGKVLLDFDHRIPAGKIARICGKDEDWLYQLFFESELTMMFDEGKITPFEFYEKIKKATGIKISFNEFVPIWSDIFTEKQDVCELARSLKKDYKVMLVSNVNKLHFELIKRKFSIISDMDAIILSYEVGAMKPDPKIYRAAINASRTEPSRIIYLDDRQELIEGGRKMGFSSFCFTDLEQLDLDLKGLKIDINEYIKTACQSNVT